MLSACATKYDKEVSTSIFSRNGFSVSQLQGDMFRVSFNGSSGTSRIKVDDFAMLKAAETALEYGYPYFEIINQQSSSDRLAGSPVVSAGRHFGYIGIGFGLAPSRAIKTLQIRGLSEKGNRQSLDAAQVQLRLRKQYMLGEPKQ